MTREEALELLKGGAVGIKKWNEWMASRDDHTQTFDLKKANLNGAILYEANLNGANLNEANLIGADLSEASLFEANLINAKLDRANLTGGNLIKAHLSGANLSGANLERAKLNEANLVGASLNEAYLRKANLVGANLNEAYLRRANLAGANLNRADLGGAKLNEAILYEANLNGANLSWANLNGANLSGADLTKAILKWADLTKADVTNSNLNQADLGWADLCGADLSGASLGGAKFDGCRLNRTVLDSTDGRRTDFSSVQYVAERLWGRIWEYLRQLFGWQTVRSVGGLQILTKASYVMLAIVPILAATWQGVSMWVGKSKHDMSESLKHIDRSSDHRHTQIDAATNQKSDELRGAIQRLQLALEQREKLLLGAAPKELVDSLKNLDHAIERNRTAILTKSEHDTGEIHKATKKLQEILDRDDFNPTLPTAWALGFFAALFVVCGHFVYQVWCPELIKGQSADKFAESMLTGHTVDPNGHSRNDELQRVINSLSELAALLPNRRHKNLVRRHGRVMWIPSNTELFQLPPEVDASRGSKASRKLADQPISPIISAGPGLMRVAVEEGSRAEYELKSLENRYPAATALLMYAVAGSIIVWLVITQSLAVAKASGWIK